MLNSFEDSMKNFTIDKEHLCSVTVHEYYDSVKDKDNPTAEELFEILRRGRSWASISSKDHPAFAELREELGLKGYIEIQRSWWNGDRVMKSFRLNGYLFKPGERFSCGAAMSGHFRSELKYHPKRFRKIK